MDTMLKLSAVKKKMRSKPKGQRLYQFFHGAHELLTPGQIKELDKIIEKEYNDLKEFLLEAKQSASC